MGPNIASWIKCVGTEVSVTPPRSYMGTQVNSPSQRLQPLKKKCRSVLTERRYRYQSVLFFHGNFQASEISLTQVLKN